MVCDTFPALLCIQVLFLKNLHHKVTEDDLLAVFGSCVEQEGTGEGGGEGGGGHDDGSQRGPPSVRVMSGRMKGQGFVEFHSESPVVS